MNNTMNNEVTIIVDKIIKKYPGTSFHTERKNDGKDYYTFQRKINNRIKNLSVEYYPNNFLVLSCSLKCSKKIDKEKVVNWISDYFEMEPKNGSF